MNLIKRDYYDDKAIDKLGRILVFRELDLPLADIKLIRFILL